jgi:protease I
VAALMDNDFEQVELTEPMKALRDEGADVKIISPAQGKVQGMNHDEKADTFPVDIPLDQADPSRFDAALLPGGALNADHLRMSKEAVSFVRSMFDAGKPMAVICHAPWMLVEADIVRGRRLTSYPSIQTDIRNAGGEWVDEEVVTDRGLVTSRKPADIPAFNRKMIEEFGEGTHAQRMAGAGAGATAGAASRSHR